MAEGKRKKSNKLVGFVNAFMQNAFRKSGGEKRISSHSKARFENVLRAGEQEQKDMYDMIDEVKNMTVCLPGELNRKNMSRLLKIAESRARFFVCCEATIAQDLRQRIKSLPDDPESRSLLLRLTRAASFLQLVTFSKGPKLGEGGFGTVYLTRTAYSPKEYALKMVRINIPKETDKTEIYHFIKVQVSVLRERDAMLMVDHPFICKLRASWVEKIINNTVHYMFLMEYAPYGNLHDFIFDVFHKLMPADVFEWEYSSLLLRKIEISRKNQDGENLPTDPTVRKKVIYIYATEMASALEYLHRLEIVHRDFKLRNVLIGEDYHLRITDFGIVNPCMAYHSYTFHNLTTEKRDKALLTDRPVDTKSIEDGSMMGTFNFNATPELILEKVKETSRFFPLDMWSLGVVLFMLYCKIHPFKVKVRPCDDSLTSTMIKIMNCETCPLTHEPLYSTIIDDEDYRRVLSGLLCNVNTRSTSYQTLQLLSEMLRKLTGISSEKLSEVNMDFLSTVIPKKQPIDPPYSEWSFGEVSPYSPQGVPAIMKAFPYCADSPVL